jgi:ubiquinone/menaquinone biosynthesis C-methylase UbiE
MRLTEDARRNRELWTKSNAEYTDRQADRAWRTEGIEWGQFSVPESELKVLGDVAGKDVVELGCGTAYFSAWLAKRGARPVGADITPAQLETARRLQVETGIEFPLIEADAAEVPLPAESFDLVLSEYGASIWVDPYRWIPEAARLLRPGGELVFLCNSTLSVLCSPDTDEVVGEQLLRPQFGMHRFDQWDGVEYHIAHGDWIALLRDNGFEVEALFELQAPAGAETHEYYAFVPADWARRWPAEEIWKARKRG